MPSSLENLRSQLFFSPPVPTTDFSDKTVIVTGSNTGLGYEAAKHFIHLNASKVILAVRSLEKGEAAREKIIAAASSHISPERIEVWYVDLGIYRTVLEFCKRAEKLSRLDVLLLNAGIVALKFKILEDNESTITTNVVSPFLMLSLLLPKLQQTSACFKTLPHIVVVTSQMHEMAIFPPYKEGSLFSSINDEKTVKINDRYNLSKLLEILIVREWAAILPSTEVAINCVSPGFCHSDLTRDVSGLDAVLIRFGKFLMARTTEVGSRTLVYASSAGQTSHGGYILDNQVKPPSDFVLSQEGKIAQKNFYKELMLKIQNIRTVLANADGN